MITDGQAQNTAAAGAGRFERCVAWVLKNLDAAIGIACCRHCLLHNFFSNIKNYLSCVVVA